MATGEQLESLAARAALTRPLQFAAPVYANLASIVRAARTINATTANTEFVVLGWLGHGKSSLVEA